MAPSARTVAISVSAIVPSVNIGFSLIPVGDPYHGGAKNQKGKPTREYMTNGCAREKSWIIHFRQTRWCPRAKSPLGPPFIKGGNCNLRIYFPSLEKHALSTVEGRGQGSF